MKMYQSPKHIEISLPKIAHLKVGMSLITEWKVNEKDDQEQVADASLANMENNVWPDGLLSYYTYLGNDGYSILHYSHWQNEQKHLNFLERGLLQRLQEINKGDSIKEQNMLGKYRMYRSFAAESSLTPGCIVIIREEFDSPENTPKWIDTVIKALESEEQPPEGALSAHFHISLDGKTMLNYAEWTSEQAHEDAMKRSEHGTIGNSPLWKKVLEFPGRKNINSLKRFKFYRGYVREE